MLTVRITVEWGRSGVCIIHLEHVLHFSGTPFVDFEQGCQLQPSLLYYYIFINSKFHFLILRHSALPVQSQ